MISSHAAIFAATFAMLTGLTACGQGGNDAASAERVSSDEVSVVDNDFEPANLEVVEGETVTWNWDARAAHDVVGDGFDSGAQQGGTFEHRFDEAGTYDYECTLHPGMTGRITVTAP